MKRRKGWSISPEKGSAFSKGLIHSGKSGKGTIIPDKIIIRFGRILLSPSPESVHIIDTVRSIVNADESRIAPIKERKKATKAAKDGGKESEENPSRGQIKIVTPRIGIARRITGAVRSAKARVNQKL